jgi:hypothetical protein
MADVRHGAAAPVDLARAIIDELDGRVLSEVTRTRGPAASEPARLRPNRHPSVSRRDFARSSAIDLTRPPKVRPPETYASRPGSVSQRRPLNEVSIFFIQIRIYSAVNVSFRARPHNVVFPLSRRSPLRVMAMELCHGSSLNSSFRPFGHRHRRPVLAQQPIDALRPTSVGHKTVCKKKRRADLHTCRRSQNCCLLLRILPRITLFGRHTWPGSSWFSQVFAKSAGPLA